MCKKVRDLEYSDRQIQVEEIAQALGISLGSVSTILHDCLDMRKLTACWFPKSLSDEQMATRASVCSALMKHVLAPIPRLEKGYPWMSFPV